MTDRAAHAVLRPATEADLPTILKMINGAR